MVLSILQRGLLPVLLALSCHAYARPVVLTIDANSNDGSKIGASLGQQTLSHFPDVARLYDNYLADLLPTTQFKQLIGQVDSLKATIGPEYQAEADAIAAAWQLNAIDKLGDGKLSINEFWLLQLLPDLTGVNKGSAFATANPSDNNPIAARNVDWKSTAALRNLQTITIYQYGDRTVVNLGFAGLVGAINGYNDQGLFISVMDASEQQVSSLATAANASGFEVRKILKEREKIEPAGHALLQNTYTRSLQILLADQNNVGVIEQPAGEMGVLRKPNSTLTNEMQWHGDGQLVVVDCFVLQSSPRNCYNTLDYYRWGRFADLLKPFAGKSLSVQDVITLMLDKANNRQAIFNLNTLQSIVFTPKDQILYYYTQPATGTENPKPVFEKYQLINNGTTFTDKLVDIGLLVLGVGVLAATWVFVFRGDKVDKNAKKPSA
ncbi:MAG: C45 family autoproteolytic acyltransferase/hydrolase [Methylococcales bacterium]|nr:C45 family autoproteolytic acyltransferase/hydrolase [Methylococcales bacterium]